MGYIELWIETRQATTALAKLSAQHQIATKTIAAGWGMVNMAFMAGAAGLAAMAGSAFIATNAIKGFHEQAQLAAALGDMMPEQARALRDELRGLSKEYAVSAEELATGAVVLTKAGLSADQLSGSIDTLTKLAKANGVAFESAANIGVFAVQAFNKEYSDMIELMDKAQMATQISILNIEDLQEAFQYAGTTAQMAGIGYERLLAMMAALSQVGMKAGISARGVNQAILKMVQKTDELQAWADAMGLGIQIIKDGAIDIDAIITGFGGLGMSIEVLQQSMEIFNVRSARAWAALISSADLYNEFLGKIQSSTGTLDKVFGVMMESTAFKLEQLKMRFIGAFLSEEFIDKVSVMLTGLGGSIDTVAAQLGELLLVFLKTFIEMLPDIMSMAKNFIEILRGLVPIIIGFGRAVAALGAEGIITIFIFGKFINMIPILAKQYSLLAGMTWTYGYSLKYATIAMGVMAAGLSLMIMAEDDNLRILGALVVALGAAAAAYWALAAARVAAAPWLALGVAAAVGTVAVVAASSMARPKAEDYTVSMPTTGTGGTYSGATMKSYRTGVLSVPETGPAFLHKGERVLSEEEADVGYGIYMDFRGSTIVDHDEFIELVRRKLAAYNIEERGISY